MFRIPKTVRKQMRAEYKEAHDPKLKKQLESQNKGADKIYTFLDRLNKINNR